MISFGLEIPSQETIVKNQVVRVRQELNEYGEAPRAQQTRSKDRN